MDTSREVDPNCPCKGEGCERLRAAEEDLQAMAAWSTFERSHAAQHEWDDRYGRRRCMACGKAL